MIKCAGGTQEIMRVQCEFPAYFACYSERLAFLVPDQNLDFQVMPPRHVRYILHEQEKRVKFLVHGL